MALVASDPRPTGRRQQRVDDTRRRIIESARELFGTDGFSRVGLEQVAAEAGVGRKTIYFQFGSKLGLLEALVSDMSRQAGISDFVAAAVADRDPASGLRTFINGSCSLWEQEAGLCRALLTLAASDADARNIIDRVGTDRLADLRQLTNGAHRRGRLRQGWSPARAAGALWLLSSFESYDLMRRAGKSGREAARLLCDLGVGVFNTEGNASGNHDD